MGEYLMIFDSIQRKIPCSLYWKKHMAENKVNQDGVLKDAEKNNWRTLPFGATEEKCILSISLRQSAECHAVPHTIYSEKDSQVLSGLMVGLPPGEIIPQKRKMEGIAV